MCCRPAARCLVTTASIFLAVALLGAPTAFADHTDFFTGDDFLLESDYLWDDDTTQYTTFDGEPGTPSNPHNQGDPDCSPSANGMQATSWWQVRGTGRRTFITTSHELTGTDYNTVMAVYEKGIGDSIGDLVDCVDDDDGADDRGSTVVLDPSVRGQDYLVQVGSVTGTGGHLEIFASSDVPGNDERANAESVGAGTQVVRENFGATPVGASEDCGGRPYAKTVWFRFDAPERGRITFDVLSSFFTVIALYSGDAGAPVTCGDDLSSASARIATGDLAAGSYFLQVGAIDDHDNYFENDFDPDEGVFLYEVSFTPDSDDDDDGVADGQDRCPLVAGTGSVRDCPDPDNDGWADGIDDRCNGLGGRDANRHQGCPDNDADGIAEGSGASPRDLCPKVNPDKVDRNDRRPRDGCPDKLKIATTASTTGHFYAGGIVVDSFALKAVPENARVKLVCKLPRGGRCGGLTIRRASATSAKTVARAARTVGVKKKLNRRLPFGTRITASIKARYAASRFIRVTVNRSAGFLKACGPSPRKLKRCK